MSIRQEKFASVLQHELANIFTQHSSALFAGQFITITKITVSPDLGYAKVYLSFIQAKEQAQRQELLNTINIQAKEIRKLLAIKIRKQVRIIPALEFFIDDSLDYVFKMEKIFEELKNQDSKKNKS